MTAFIQEPSRDIPVLGEYDVAAALSLKEGNTPREMDPMLVVAQLEKDRDVDSAFEERIEE